MTHATARHYPVYDGSWNSWLASLSPWRNRKARRAELDVRALSDHLKRDMGFLDGNDPTGPRS